LTNSSSLSSSARDSAFAAGSRIAFTICAGRSRRYSPLVNLSAISSQKETPPAAVLDDGRREIRVRMSKRRSGLSLPYFPIDSSNGICGKRPLGYHSFRIDPEDLLARC